MAMSLLLSKQVVEPALVVVLFGASIWLNRSKKRPYALVDPSGAAESIRTCKVFGAKVVRPDTRVFADRTASRVLARFPYIFEAIYWLLIYSIYQSGRGVVALSFDEETPSVARAHGIQVLHLEQKLGIQIENGMQDWVLSHPLIMTIFNKMYSWIHIPGTIAFFGYFYHTQSFAKFADVRRTMAMSNLIAFVGFTLYPTMPPRLLPSRFGFVDTIHRSHAVSVWNSKRFQNPYAAMPSLHFGYAWISGISLFLHAKHFRGRFNFLALLYPLAILLAIIVTANHYLLDALAGYLVTAMAFRTNTLLLNFLIVEDWILYALRVHKPDPSDDLDSAHFAWHDSGDMEQQRGSARPALVRHMTA